MKLLLNDKEISHFLVSQVDHLDALKMLWNNQEKAGEVISYIIFEKQKPKFNLEKMRKKFKDKIRGAVERDLKSWWGSAKDMLDNRKKFYFKLINQNLDYFVDKIGEDVIFDQYKKSWKQNFVKSVGYQIDPKAVMVRRTKFNNPQENCLIRNTVGNEQLLISKIDNKLPFWFIDSGYTNFVESNKKWHRIVENHLHYGQFFDAPADRLGNFKTFPKPWKTGGDKILVIEPGSFAANIFHVNIADWKKWVVEELRKHTDKEIVFREKFPKKTRPNLFKHLNEEDYYCVISINSNAATEAVWAGVPIITLGTHITNPIARNKLSDINDLYRPNIASWLAMLSYSQFTYEELLDGTAVKLIKKYHV
jgi:hypothetical protein